jgi:perosamine synthetase
VVRVTPAAGVTRDEFLNAVQAQGIGLGVHFRAVHLHPYYREAFGFTRGMLPVAEAAGDAVVSLPLYPVLREDELERVVRACEVALAAAS